MSINVPPGYYGATKHVPKPHTGQVAVGQASILLIEQDLSRVGAVLCNTGANTVFIGDQNTDLVNDGHALPAGASIGLSTPLALYGQAVAGTNVVTFLEERIV